MNAARRVHAGSIGAGARFWGSQARRLCRSLPDYAVTVFRRENTALPLTKRFGQKGGGVS